MRKILFGLLLVISLSSHGQQVAKKATFEYIRSKLLSLAPTVYSEITFDESSCVVKLSSTTKVYALCYFSNLDANGISWDIYSKLLRITISSKSGLTARRFFLEDGSSNGGESEQNVAVFSFEIARAADIQDFQSKMTKAFKNLIALCGGHAETKDPFN